MKRKISLCIVVTALAFFYCILISNAKENMVKSHGSIEGKLQLYTEDIWYLRNEINLLLAECGGAIG